MLKYKNVIILVCLCVISLILSWSYNPNYRKSDLDFPVRENNPIKSAFSFLLIPNNFLERIISLVSAKIGDIGYFFVRMFQKPVQIEEFQSLEASFQDLQRQLYEERNRNRRLEELWRFSSVLTKNNPSFRLLPANVISVEPTDWFRYLTIDKGSRHGLKADMPVITSAMYPPPGSTKEVGFLTGAIVGRIKNVQPNSSKVQLITDQLSVIAVTIGSLGDLVLLRGKPETESCVIDEIPSTTHDLLKDYSAVTVDERSSIFPPGMLVGWISSIKKETYFCRIEVQPAFKFSRLRELLVVMDFE